MMSETKNRKKETKRQRQGERRVVRKAEYKHMIGQRTDIINDRKREEREVESRRKL